MYTVSWVSQQLGMNPSTLRAWEQRYGIVRPTRSGGGFRLYDDEDLDTLKAMAALVAGGMPPSQAAEEIRSGRPRARHRPNQVSNAPVGLPDPHVLVDASREFDSRTVDDTMNEAFASAGFEYVVDEWLTGAMAELGRAWADGDLSVAQEHFISAAVMRRLAAAFDAAGHARSGHHVIVGLAPGATHEIAALAFATMLRRLGIRVTYLGANIPVESWVQTVSSIRPAAVVIGAPRAGDASAASEVADALFRAGTSAAVYTGGSGAAGGHILVGDTLAGAANHLADTIATVRPPSVVRG